ncbi:hypothetical protein B0T26DRAFT_738798 [Lasiosphaeria miniovina]|uniref:Thioredoxin-like fold domain-containing protein n=1 Tax=Lasiosphaeria miniovina TaxID=1954250 RepID=A0AA40B6H7_9PEZI|nr:uncharacterized protein B0T26DRAFT_738798 [Lasiosphaeria miniovina]KAK0728462.1 hypothetical protein B0T26DRAFT_738798 [Lasiosphaeria miniovina]
MSVWPSPTVPRPLQQLFDRVPLLTYDANALPARSQSATSSRLPTLYVFSTDSDARLGAPSYNPGCLKWQTFLKLARVEFQIVPATNHASPTGALPFLLPARPSPSASPAPVSAARLHKYALEHGQHKPAEQTPTLRLDAYQALLDVPIRNAWLQALYLEPRHAALLGRLYVAPASSSLWVQATLRHQLRRAAEAEILKTSSSAGGGGASAATPILVDESAMYAGARDALDALADLLAESETGWFFGAPSPSLFDASVFAYTHLMRRLLDGGADGEGEDLKIPARLGALVRDAGTGELESHRSRLLEMLWPGESLSGR